MKNMKDVKKFGIVIADESEYVMFRELADKLSAERCDFYTREGHHFVLADGVELYSVLCGIGTVNAAAAATHLAEKGVCAMLSFGLSGGISGITKNEFMVGERYLEHDFDLTPLGYELCVKPLQDYIYDGSPILNDTFLERYPFIKKGVIVSGDSFICDDNKRVFFKEQFGAMSCDMESAAVAYVCTLAGIHYTSLRKISDDAGNDADVSYSASLDIDGEQVLSIILSVIESVAEKI